MSKNVLQRGRNVTIPAPYDCSPGELVVVGSVHGWAVDFAVEGAPVVITTEGVGIEAVGSAVNVGDALIWDADNHQLAKLTSTGTVRAVCVRASTGGTAQVKLTPAIVIGDGSAPSIDVDGVTVEFNDSGELTVISPFPGTDGETIVEDDAGKLAVASPYPAELAYLTTDGPVSVATSTNANLPLIVGDVVDVDLNAGEPKIEVEGFYAVQFSTLFEAVTGNIECVLMGSTLGIIGDDDADNLTGVPATIGGCRNIWLPANEVLTMSAKHTNATNVDVTGKIWVKRIG